MTFAFSVLATVSLILPLVSFAEYAKDCSSADGGAWRAATFNNQPAAGSTDLRPMTVAVADNCYFTAEFDSPDGAATHKVSGVFGRDNMRMERITKSNGCRVYFQGNANLTSDSIEWHVSTTGGCGVPANYEESRTFTREDGGNGNGGSSGGASGGASGPLVGLEKGASCSMTNSQQVTLVNYVDRKINTTVHQHSSGGSPAGHSDTDLTFSLSGKERKVLGCTVAGSQLSTIFYEWTIKSAQ